MRQTIINAFAARIKSHARFIRPMLEDSPIFAGRRPLHVARMLGFGQPRMRSSFARFNVYTMYKTSTNRRVRRSAIRSGSNARFLLPRDLNR